MLLYMRSNLPYLQVPCKSRSALRGWLESGIFRESGRALTPLEYQQGTEQPDGGLKGRYLFCSGQRGAVCGQVRTSCLRLHPFFCSATLILGILSLGNQNNHFRLHVYSPSGRIEKEKLYTSWVLLFLVKNNGICRIPSQWTCSCASLMRVHVAVHSGEVDTYLGTQML